MNKNNKIKEEKYKKKLNNNKTKILVSVQRVLLQFLDYDFSSGFEQLLLTTTASEQVPCPALQSKSRNNFYDTVKIVSNARRRESSFPFPNARAHVPRGVGTERTFMHDTRTELRRNRIPHTKHVADFKRRENKLMSSSLQKCLASLRSFL